MSTHHKRDSHQRYARIVSADGHHARDVSGRGDLHLRALAPRFSPTAIWPTASSSSTASDPLFGPATDSTSPVVPIATPPVHTKGPKTPVLVTTPLLPSTTPSTSSTPTSTSTSTFISISTPTTSSTSSSSTSSLIPFSPVVVPTSSFPAFTDSFTPPVASSVTTPTISATPSATPLPSGGTSTSAVVGGIAAGLVGVAGLIFAIMFFVRRSRKRSEEEQEFNADAFRRQSAILVDDEPSSYNRGGGNSGFNPRPPTMIERHVANRNQFNDVPPMPSLQQYNNLSAGGAGIGASGYGNNGYEFPRAQQQPSFSPGQVIPTSPALVGGQGFASDGRATSPYDPVYSEQSQLARHPSSTAAVYDQYGHPISLPSNATQGDLGGQNSVGGNAHYVDLMRSSVTPFQAAQYAEISRKLNKSPTGLHAVNESEEPASHASDPALFANQAGAESSSSIPTGGGNLNSSSPFADPQAPAEAQLISPMKTDQFLHANEAVQPTSPVYSLHSQKTSFERPVSKPPTLPQISGPERTFSPTSYDFPRTPSGRPTPSPLHSNFPVQLTGEKVSAGFAPKAAVSQRPTSTYTVYDEGDAYGGI